VRVLLCSVYVCERTLVISEYTINKQNTKTPCSVALFDFFCTKKFEPRVVKGRVADPGSSALFSPGSGFRIRDGKKFVLKILKLIFRIRDPVPF
jgi:hypothetical protein